VEFLCSGVGLLRPVFYLAVFLLWILFRTVHLGDLRHALAAIDPWDILSAIVMFGLAIAQRSLRWRVLLESIGLVRYKRVAFVLIIGYAVNNLLPARLGEVFRAGFGIGGSAALGTIAIERTVDGLVFVLLLSGGLAAAAKNNVTPSRRTVTIRS
jgi:hypothetical protein